MVIFQLLAQHWHAIAGELHPTGGIGQFERLAILFAKGLADPQGDAEPQLGEALAIEGFALHITADTQLAARSDEAQQVAGGLAVYTLSVVLECQRGAVLDLLGHAPFAGIEMHTDMAVEQQVWPRFQVGAQDLFDFGLAGPRCDASAMGILQGQQGCYHVLAVVPHRAAAQAVHFPRGVTAGLQAYGLPIVVLFGAPAAGFENLPFDGEQRGAALFRVAPTARHAAPFETLEPVALGHPADVGAHERRSAVGERYRSNCINFTGRIRETANSRTAAGTWAAPGDALHRYRAGLRASCRDGAHPCATGNAAMLWNAIVAVGRKPRKLVRPLLCL